MKLFFTLLLTLFILGPGCCQNMRVDDFVQKIEKLRKERKLVSKTDPDKTVVGSLTGYYIKDSLVLINSLTDAESAGTETLYYIQNGKLFKVYIMAVLFDSPDEWNEYHLKHLAADNCHSCHSKANCKVTVVSFDGPGTVEETDEGQAENLSQDQKTKILTETLATWRELNELLKEL